MNAIKSNYQGFQLDQTKNMIARRINSRGRFLFCIFLLICLAISLLQSCAYHNEEALYPDSNCNLTGVSFSNDIRPLIEVNCAISGCHVPGTGNISYTTFEGFKTVAENGRLHHMVVETRQMPPVGSLSECSIDKIEAWINQGALNN